MFVIYLYGATVSLINNHCLINNDCSTYFEVAAVDLLLPEVGEVCGGSLRESNLQILEGKLNKQGLGQSLSWCVSLYKY